MLFGLALLPIGGGLLFWNEGRAVQTARSLAEGAGLVRSVAAERADPANEGRLVHVSGPLSLGSLPRDPEFGLTPPAGTLRLRRFVEMYQWSEEQESETSNRLGGGTETVTTYRYSRAWIEGRVGSSRFRQAEGHQNPQPRFASAFWTAEGIRLGGFRLDAGQLGGIEATEALPAPAGNLGTASGNTLHIGNDAAAPRVGDRRVTWMAARPEGLSLIAAQLG
jgi:hypothetical protein